MFSMPWLHEESRPSACRPKTPPQKSLPRNEILCPTIISDLIPLIIFACLMPPQLLSPPAQGFGNGDFSHPHMRETASQGRRLGVSAHLSVDARAVSSVWSEEATVV